MFCATSFAPLIFLCFFRFCYIFSVFANENESSGSEIHTLTRKQPPNTEQNGMCIQKELHKMLELLPPGKTPPTRPSAHNSALKLHLFIFGHLLWQFKMFARADVLYPAIFYFWYICICTVCDMNIRAVGVTAV